MCSRMKYELGGKIITEFVELKSKMYSLIDAWLFVII